MSNVRRKAPPIILKIQEFIRGRGFIEPLRFVDQMAARNQPPPDIPGGPYHKTSKIYYFTRDARRMVQPPEVITTNKQITAGSSDTALKSTTPNKVYLPE